VNSGIFIGKIWDIPIRLHLSWFIIFGLVTWSLAVGYFPLEYDSLSPVLLWVLGAVTSLLFALSVLLHELGHSYFALRSKVPVSGVTLFIFGGVAQIKKEPKSPGEEFRIAIAGPATSLLLAGFFGLIWLLDRSVLFLAAPSAWLARINFFLAVFNLIPGYPLDGGRVLRSIIWERTKSLARATQVAASVGQSVALIVIVVGIFTIFSGELYNGLWLAFIGWFLQNAATSSLSQSTIQHSLKGVQVSQVMNTQYETVPGDMTLKTLIDEHILTGGKRIFLVMDTCSFEPCGMITIKDLKTVEREQWATIRVRDVMVPKRRLISVSPQTALLEALHKMDDFNVAQMPVMDGEVLMGVLSREQILHYIRLRSEIGV